MRSTAFTLIELLVVVSIISIISAATIPNFSNYINSQALTQSQEQIISDLRAAQNKALTGSGYINPDETVNTFWGVKFIQDAKSYFSFITNSPEANLSTACSSAVVAQDGANLPKDVVLRVNDYVCIFFSFETGNAVGVAPAGFDALTIPVGTSDMVDTECAGVQVNDYGRIYKVANVQCSL